jgi:hemolysin activation/secretion protein
MKLDATAIFTLPKLGSAALAYRGMLGRQYVNVALYGSEQLYRGGIDTIRGFRSGEIVGDWGFMRATRLRRSTYPRGMTAASSRTCFLIRGSPIPPPRWASLHW